jgi:hypothetical protein
MKISLAWQKSLHNRICRANHACQENNAVENSQTLNNRDIANTFFLVFFLASYTWLFRPSFEGKFLMHGSHQFVF